MIRVKVGLVAVLLINYQTKGSDKMYSIIRKMTYLLLTNIRSAEK
jgi:hypothetical protein